MRQLLPIVHILPRIGPETRASRLEAVPVVPRRELAGPVLLLAAAIALAGGCIGDRLAGGGQCSGGKCDGTGESALDGRGDPIADFLRDSQIGDDLVLDTDFFALRDGIATGMGCSPSSLDTFLVVDALVEDSPFPRVVTTACSDDDARASSFFIAASSKLEGAGEAPPDVDPRMVEMFAWDAEAQIYRFYKAEPGEGSAGAVRIRIEPSECRDCHLTPSNLDPRRMPMTPILNELTAPWPHWRAEPDFPSLAFELPADLTGSASFARMTEHLASVARFEQIIRAGHSKVAQARLRERRTSPPDLDQVMGLLRPIFCDEQVNYVSEDHTSGVLDVSALVSSGLAGTLRAVQPTDLPWSWLDGTVRLPAGDPAVFMMPVRGNVDVDLEAHLIGVRALSPEQVLRVRSLDWKTPVLSDFRCELWRSALDRYQFGPPELDPSWKNSDAIPVVFEDIMTRDGVALRPSRAGRVIAMDLAGDETVAALSRAIHEGTLAAVSCGAGGSGFCEIDLLQLGALIEDHVTNTMASAGVRQTLDQERQRRICQVQSFFPNQPSLPAVTCTP